jgi:GntR family transcriptional regulator
MDFLLDKHSALPIHAQIKEQIKVALLVGHIRPGDTLPSIRDVEKQTNINRNIVRKAYLELQEAGILDLRHGKGVQVRKTIKYPQHAHVHKEAERLSEEILTKLKRMRISPTAFARYLYQQARTNEAASPYMVYVDATQELADSRAAQISSIWQMDVPGLAMQELAKMPAVELKKIRNILVNYLRVEQVQKLLPGGHINVIPLGLTFKATMVSAFKRFPKDANLVFVVDDRDYPSLTMILELYRTTLMGPGMEITSMPLKKVGSVPKFLESNKYHKVIFSNRIWDSLPDDCRKHPKAVHPEMEMELVSLENARIVAGAIV